MQNSVQKLTFRWFRTRKVFGAFILWMVFSIGITVEAQTPDEFLKMQNKPSAPPAAPLPNPEGNNVKFKGAKSSSRSEKMLAIPKKDSETLEIEYVKTTFLDIARDLKELETKPYPIKMAQAEGCRALIAEGISAWRDGNRDAAEEFLKESLVGQCYDGLAAFYLGISEFEEKNFQDAYRYTRQAYQQFQTHRPSHPYRITCSSTLGRAYLNMGKPLESSFYLKQVIDQFPLDLPHTYFYGVALLKSGSLGSAKEQFRKVTRLADQTPNANYFTSEAYAQLATIYFDQRNYFQARKDTVDAIRWNPKNKQLRNFLNQIDQTKKSQNTNEFNSDLTETFGNKGENEL